MSSPGSSKSLPEEFLRKPSRRCGTDPRSVWFFHLRIFGSRKMRDPQVTMGCNSKSWSKDLDDLGSFVCDCLVVLHYTCMQHVWEILRVSLLFQKGGPSKKCHERRDWISAVLNGTSRINQTARLLGRLVAWTPTPFLATQRAWLHEGTKHINHAS